MGNCSMDNWNPEFRVEFYDVNGDEATIHVHKMGGGRIGRKYTGRWKVYVDGIYGETEIMDFSSGAHYNHLGVAMNAYQYYLQDRQ